MKKTFIVAMVLLFLTISVFADDHINALKIETTDGAYLLILDHIAFLQITNHKDLWIYFFSAENPIHFVYFDTDGAQKLFNQIEALLNQKPPIKKEKE